MRLQEAVRKAEVVTRDWNNMSGGFDQAYLSHYHTLEIIEELALEYGFFKTNDNLMSLSRNEYRNTFISLGNSKEFAVTTMVYIDSSTYTYVHPNEDRPVLTLNQECVHKLSNADIRRCDDRARRKREIVAALTSIGFIPEVTNKPTEKRSKGGGPVYRKDADGTYTLDYTGIKDAKIRVERTLDYSKFNRPGADEELTENSQGIQEGNVGETPEVAGPESDQSDTTEEPSEPASHTG